MMMKMTKTMKPWMFNIATLMLVGLFLATQGASASPKAESTQPLASSQTLISYQGTLTDAGGNPINGTVTIEFSLYDAESGGNQKWGPETQVVEVSEGFFHVLLGRVAAIVPANLAGDLWLAIVVNGEVLSPRELLASVVHAVEASGISGDLDMNGNQINVVGDIDFGASVGKKVYWYGNTYYTGIESNTLYEVSNRYFRWYDASTGPDDGASAAMQLDANTGNMQVQGRIGVGRSSSSHGQVIIGTNAVPLAFQETDQTGAGSLWRMPLDGKHLRFDASQNGTDFAGYKTALTLYADGSLGCGALTEANLQTPEEHAAGGIDRFEEGDVLCWAGERLEKCTVANDRLVQAVADASGRPIVIGAEPVKVIGPVRYGDLLVASDVPGYAMVNNDARVGTVIAQALEDFDGERGIIKAMIRKF